jgi:glycogen debranching enzyme
MRLLLPRWIARRQRGPARKESAEDNWIQVLEGSTFMLSDPRGDVAEGSSAGLFHEDTRFVSRFELEVNGARPSLLSAGAITYYSAAFFLTNPQLDGIPAGSLSIQRYRNVGDGLAEVLVVHSHLDRPVGLELRVRCGADFADLFEVKAITFTKRGTLSKSGDPATHVLRFDYSHDAYEAATRIHSSEPARIQGSDLLFDVSLEPRATWKTRLEVAVVHGGEMIRPLTEEERAASRALQQWREGGSALARWQEEAPQLDTDWSALKLIYEQSIVDLAALRLRADFEGNDFSLPAAGLPWFMAIFGRDTLITSYQCLLVSPELARGALHSLTRLQGEVVDDFKDEEPGKILHEIRFGELATIGEKPHRPYYGTADATPLFLVLLSEYWRLTGDAETVRDLRDSALRALEWIDRYGDADGDGYVEYATRSSQGLRNQGWKDSWDAVHFADGRLAEPPIALCEVQGYVYDAKVRAAELAEAVWGEAELAARLRSEAAGLYDRFNEDFWVDARGGYYAEALDADKRQADALTSNIGHLLWSGIVPEERAALLRDRLFSPAMFSGWGIRTLSSEDARYNPIRYHNGTVWPHDNSLISAGLSRYGFREEANRIATALLEAAAPTEYRLPEVFAGYARRESVFPVRYPTASSPQAWAAAAPFLWLRLMLGIEVEDGRVGIDPHLPAACGRVSLSGVRILGRAYDAVVAGASAEIRAAG